MQTIQNAMGTLQKRVFNERPTPKLLPHSDTTNPTSLPHDELNREIILYMRQNAQIPVPWCDWYERMISGMHFSTSFDPLLKTARLNALRQCKFINDDSLLTNSTSDIDFTAYRAEKHKLLKSFLGKLGTNSHMEAPVHIMLGCNLLIGSDTRINYGVKFHDLAPITIGNRVFVGPDVKFITEGHSTDVSLRRAKVLFAYPIWVGDDVWIGANVVVLPGVKIGKGVTVAAGAVVTRDVPDFCIVAGVPARVVRRVKDVDGGVGMVMKVKRTGGEE